MAGCPGYHLLMTASYDFDINGGIGGSPLLTPARLHAMYGVAAENYLEYAALRGDASDNLPGVTGIGEKAAAALLLGAVLAPTDPVLASEVQVGEPADDEAGTE